MTIGAKPISDSTHQLFNQGSSQDILNNSQGFVNPILSDSVSVKSGTSIGGKLDRAHLDQEQLNSELFYVNPKVNGKFF